MPRHAQALSAILDALSCAWTPSVMLIHPQWDALSHARHPKWCQDTSTVLGHLSRAGTPQLYWDILSCAGHLQLHQTFSAMPRLPQVPDALNCTSTLLMPGTLAVV
jgi:hypothetical protein